MGFQIEPNLDCKKNSIIKYDQAYAKHSVFYLS